MAKILIAEDERDIRELIEFTLQAYAGHQVFKAANGAEAVELASQVLPDLIMLDVRMPRMTGYEACKELKKIDATKDIPVVFLSAKGQESEIDTGLEAGAYDYILKPFAPDQLAGRVTDILEKFKTRAAQQVAAPTPTASATQPPAPQAMPSAPTLQPPPQPPVQPVEANPPPAPQAPPQQPPKP